MYERHNLWRSCGCEHRRRHLPPDERLSGGWRLDDRPWGAHHDWVAMSTLRCWPGCVAEVISGVFKGRFLTCVELYKPLPDGRPTWRYSAHDAPWQFDDWVAVSVADSGLRPISLPPRPAEWLRMKEALENGTVKLPSSEELLKELTHG